MKDLNGHYCLATKANYDKLVEDGHTSFDIEDGYKNCNYLFIDDVIDIDGCIPEPDDLIPMHLHNNEWHMGSLEHDEDKEIDEYFATIPKKETHKMVRKPNQVEHITREDYNSSIEFLKEKYFCNAETVDKYVKYLESNQKANTCETCSVNILECPIINAIADKGSIRVVNFGCTEHKAKENN